MAARLLRLLKSRFGPAAPRMRVAPHLPWWARAAVVVAMLAVGVWVLAWVYDIGLKLAGFERAQAKATVAALEQEMARLAKENERLGGEVARLAQNLEIERSTNRHLAQNLKASQDENAALKEDLAFFRQILSANKAKDEAGSKGADGVAVYHAKIERDPLLPYEYRYRLLVLKTGTREQAFEGGLKLLLRGAQAGRDIVLAVPADGLLPVAFRYHQRVEGRFRVPEGFALRSAQVRLFEAGKAEPRVIRSIPL